MRVIAKPAVTDFIRKHPDSEASLNSWYALARAAIWGTPNDIRNDYRSADFVANDRVIFNISGNHYRLVTEINYKFGIVFIRFLGTHAEYDRVDATTVKRY